MTETYEIRTAYADYLQSKDWDYFATVTCRNPRKDTLAFIRDYASVISPAWMGTHRAFVAVEPHRTGMIHIHSLLYFSQPVNIEGHAGYHPAARELEEKFNRTFGRSRVDIINSRDDVACYCSKYVTKRTNQGYDYNFLGENWGV